MPSQYSLGSNAPIEFPLPSLVDPGNPNSVHNICLVRRLSPQALLGAGILDHLDGLTAIVQKQHLSGKGNGSKVAAVQSAAANRKRGKAASADEEAEGVAALQEFLANKGDLNQVFGLMDRLVELAVVEPKVLRPVVRDEFGRPVTLIVDGKDTEIPLPTSERTPNVLYTDEVDLGDKSAITAFVMSGTQALETFRSERS